MNLLKMLQDQMGGELMEQAGKFLGESKENTSSAMGAALPSILGSLISKGSSQSGASGILDMVTKGGFNGDMLSNLGSMFGGGDSTSGLVKSGGGILSSLLGNKMGGLVDTIASLSGMKKSSSSSLLSMAAPIVMNMLGKHILGNKLNAGGLMKFLGSQAGFVKDALPSGISDLMGFGNLGNSISETVGAASKTVGNAADEVKSSGGGIMKWIIIGLLGLLAAWYFGIRTGCSNVDNLTDKVGDTTSSVVTGAADLAGDATKAAGDLVKDGTEAIGDAGAAAGEMLKDGANAAADFANKALEGVSFAAGSAGESLKNIFSGDGDKVGKTVTFKTMNFATGKADVPADAMSEVNNLAALLKAFPNATIEIGGHTDNVGNADNNNTLSAARAGSVKAALVKAGINGDRITTKGYGSAKPKASNDTKEGQAANRRIEVMVTK